MPSRCRICRLLRVAGMVVAWVLAAAWPGRLQAAQGPPAVLDLAGFRIENVTYKEAPPAETRENTVSGEGDLVLPFPALPDDRRLIHMAFANLVVNEDGLVRAGKVTAEPEEWSWQAAGGLSLAIARLNFDAGAGTCTFDGSLLLGDFFRLPNLQGIPLSSDGILKGLPPFAVSGTNCRADQAELDLSTQGPAGREAFLGVLFRDIAIALPAPNERVLFRGRDLALGVRDGALSITGDAAVEADEVRLDDVAGSGIGVLLARPALRYADGWALASERVQAALPPALRQRLNLPETVALRNPSLLLTRTGTLSVMATLENRVTFALSGMQGQAENLELDLSPILPGDGKWKEWLGIRAPQATMRLGAPYENAEFTVTDLAFGVQGGAVRLSVGNAALKADTLALANLAGTGIDLAVSKPELRYADGWSLAGDVSAKLPRSMRGRQVRLAGAALRVAANGKLQCSARDVALDPPLDLEWGSFDVRDVGRMAFDFSETESAAPGMDVAWQGVVFRSGKVVAALPVPQETQPDLMEFAFTNLAFGLANGKPRLGGEVALAWAAPAGEGRAFSLAGWRGAQVAVTSARLKLSPGETTHVSGTASGSIRVPGLEGEPLTFRDAEWSSDGLFAGIRLENDLTRALPAPLNGSLTVKRAEGETPSLILDLSTARSPGAGPGMIRDAGWRGLYFANVALTTEVGNLGAVELAATDAFLDPGGLSAVLSLARPTVLPLRCEDGRPSFPVRWQRAALALERGTIVGGALAGDLYLFDRPLAFALAAGRGGRWEGRLRTEKAVSLDLGLIRLDLTDGVFDPTGRIKVSGLAYARLGVESPPIAFSNLAVKWPLEIPPLEFPLAQPAAFSFYGFQAEANRFRVETRADPATLRLTLGGKLVLPEMQGMCISAQIPGLTVATPYGAEVLMLAQGVDVPKLAKPRLEWEGGGAQVAVKVAEVLEAKGAVAWGDEGDRHEFRGDLALQWMRRPTQGGAVRFALGRDGQGEYWVVKVDAPTDVALGPGLKLTHVKATAAWGMKGASTRAEDPGDQVPANPPDMTRDPEARFFTLGFVQLGKPGEQFHGWFGMALGLPGPYMALCGSPKILGQTLGSMHLSWNPELKEFRGAGTFTKLFDGFPKPPGFQIQPSQFDILVGANRWHLKLGWPEGDRPKLCDLNQMVGPPTHIPNAIGWGFALQGEGSPARLGVGAALAAGLKAEGSWAIFYARAVAIVGGKVWVELAPATPHPMYGGGTVWAELSGRGGLKVAGARYEVISISADTILAVMTPGPPDRKYGTQAYRADRWQVSGAMQLAYHLKLLLVSLKGSTRWAFATSF